MAILSSFFQNPTVQNSPFKGPLTPSQCQEMSQQKSLVHGRSIAAAATVEAGKLSPFIRF